MFQAATVTVTDTPTLIVPVNGRRQTYIVRNIDAADTVKLGPVGVAFATGFSLAAGESMSFMVDQFVRESTSALYGICNTGVSAVVEVLSHVVDQG